MAVDLISGRVVDLPGFEHHRRAWIGLCSEPIVLILDFLTDSLPIAQRFQNADSTKKNVLSPQHETKKKLIAKSWVCLPDGGDSVVSQANWCLRFPSFSTKQFGRLALHIPPTTNKIQML